MNLAIIPARGGSKRIPRKNIRSFRGKPILAWSIEAARSCGLFEQVLVSTDDEEIAQTATELGASVPFLRSERNSNDFATTADVLQEVLAQLEGQGQMFDAACSLYPTAPFVTAEDLAEGLKVLQQGWDCVLPVSAFSYPIWRSLKRLPDGRIAMNFPENVNARSQDLPVAYHDAGQWCWFKVEPFRQSGLLFGERTGSVLLPPDRVQDIDTEEDWRLAEWKHERLFG